MKKIIEVSEWCLLAGCTLIVCLFLFIILSDLFVKGLPVISWNFIVEYPKEGLTKGGIFPAIIGTDLLTIITTGFAVLFGIACEFYLN